MFACQLFPFGVDVKLSLTEWAHSTHAVLEHSTICRVKEKPGFSSVSIPFSVLKGFSVPFPPPPPHSWRLYMAQRLRASAERASLMVSCHQLPIAFHFSAAFTFFLPCLVQDFPHPPRGYLTILFLLPGMFSKTMWMLKVWV